MKSGSLPQRHTRASSGGGTGASPHTSAKSSPISSTTSSSLSASTRRASAPVTVTQRMCAPAGG